MDAREPPFLVPRSGDAVRGPHSRDHQMVRRPHRSRPAGGGKPQVDRLSTACEEPTLWHRTELGTTTPQDRRPPDPPRLGSEPAVGERLDEEQPRHDERDVPRPSQDSVRLPPGDAGRRPGQERHPELERRQGRVGGGRQVAAETPAHAWRAHGPPARPRRRARRRQRLGTACPCRSGRKPRADRGARSNAMPRRIGRARPRRGCNSYTRIARRGCGGRFTRRSLGTGGDGGGGGNDIIPDPAPYGPARPHVHTSTLDPLHGRTMVSVAPATA